MDRRLGDVHTAIPAQVLAFDATAQTVDVQPMIKNVVVGSETETEESYPALYSVPVIYPRAGAVLVAFPLEVDDFVTIVFNEWPIDNFVEKGKESHPVDLERHGLSGAVAFPGGPYPTSAPIAETVDAVLVGYDGAALLKVKSDGTIEFGTTASAKQFAALAGDTQTEINALRSTVADLVTDINALKTATSGWTPIANDGGAAYKVAVTAWFGAPVSAPPAVNEVGSSKVKVQE
jgi:hypothetical protein